MGATLLIMAAGMGSRYGGNKQVDGLGPNGEILMEYSIYDAIRAGFDKVVFVIKPGMQETLAAICGMPIAPSQYWPMVHGSTPEDVRKDEEGMQIMRMLGRNMAYMIRAFALARENGLLPPDMEKPKMRTNFIR